MSVTIKDIAKETGLTAATISAYFNGANVRSYNKEKIDAVVQRLGYVRNDYARGLRTHRSMTIGVLIPELSNLFSTTIISEMEEDLRIKGYGIIVCDCQSDIAREKEAAKFLTSKMVDGLIVMPVSADGAAYDAIAASGTPVVAIDRMTKSKKISHIVIDNREVSKRAVKYLTDSGCKRVSIVAGSEDLYTAKERYGGYVDAMSEAGLKENIRFEIGRYTIDGGYSAVKKLFASKERPDGIFVSNYEMSVGAVIALKELGIEVGKDTAFMGFDNMDLLRVIYPQIKSVSQPIREIGQAAAETVLSLIAGGGNRNTILKAKVEI